MNKLSTPTIIIISVSGFLLLCLSICIILYLKKTNNKNPSILNKSVKKINNRYNAVLMDEESGDIYDPDDNIYYPSGTGKGIKKKIRVLSAGNIFILLLGIFIGFIVKRVEKNYY